jgi:hypothetical protein
MDELSEKRLEGRNSGISRTDCVRRVYLESHCNSLLSFGSRFSRKRRAQTHKEV